MNNYNRINLLKVAILENKEEVKNYLIEQVLLT